MKRHTKIYMSYFGYKIAEDAVCEIPGCGLPCVDVNHIDARGSGGDPQGKKGRYRKLNGYVPRSSYKIWRCKGRKGMVKRGSR